MRRRVLTLYERLAGLLSGNAPRPALPGLYRNSKSWELGRTAELQVRSAPMETRSPSTTTS